MEYESGSPSVHAVRRFTRFYTRRLDVLGEHLLESPFTLAESRVLFELAQQPDATASDLAVATGIDASYLSRLLRRLEKAEVLARIPLANDRRSATISLTPEGREQFADLNARSSRQVSAMLDGVANEDRGTLIGAMSAIERILSPRPGAANDAWLLRSHRPGDIGWVVSRHGALYASEYGWDSSFEALVAEIGASFLREFDPAREHCWIAERDGANLGSVFVVRESDAVAKLRLLIVEPSARGLGVGKRLVDECIRFATDKGYSTLTLWTNDVLHAARAIYQRAGFVLVEQEKHHSFGHDLVGQNWSLTLRR